MHQTSHPLVVGSGTSQLMGGLVGRCVIIYLFHLVACPGDFKRCPHFSGKLLVILVAGHFHKFTPTRVASGQVWSAILSIAIGVGEKALDLWAMTLAGVAFSLLLWCPLGRAPPHSGVLEGGALVAGDTPGLPPLNQDGLSFHP